MTPEIPKDGSFYLLIEVKRNRNRKDGKKISETNLGVFNTVDKAIEIIQKFYPGYHCSVKPIEKDAPNPNFGMEFWSPTGRPLGRKFFEIRHFKLNCLENLPL